MSFTAEDQLRAHFLTVSLKGQSQAGGGTEWRDNTVPAFYRSPALPCIEAMTDPA